MVMKLKAKGKWQKMASDSLKGFSDFISMEVLTDYELVGGGDMSATSKATLTSKIAKRKSEKKKNEAEESEKQTKKKKRSKRKKRAKKEDPAASDPCENLVDQHKDSVEVIGEDISGDSVAMNSVNVVEDSAADDGDVTVRGRKNVKRKSELLSSEESPNKKQKLDLAEDSTISAKKTKKKTKKKTGKTKLEGKKYSLSNLHETKSNEATSQSESMIDMSNWNGLFVPDQVLTNLSRLGFSSPTLIQQRILPVAVHGKTDIIAAAETGSGKTLAFGIPLINLILLAREKDKDEVVGVSQVEKETDGACRGDGAEEEEEEMEIDDGEDDEGEDEDGKKNEVETENKDDDGDHEETVVAESSAADGSHDDGRSLFGLVLTPTRELAYQIRDHLRSVATDTGIKCHVVVGGMSIQKQSRVLDKDRPDIVVATPGRLWDIYKQGNKHLSRMNFIRCLVIDEADRMVEKFHFEHLSFILTELNQKNSSKDYRQTFILSATLTYVPPKPQRLKHTKKKKKFQDMTTEEKLESLSSQIGIRGKPKVVDLTPKQRTASKLTETRLIFNAVEEKDLNLFCFLKENSGRTIVFANSIDCIWRLMRLFTLLEMAPLRLFADMQQKQRLQSLEKFKANPSGLLLATDVAARGLDIPGIDHVIHYEVPKTTESYIHRSGRTARANSEGFSILFVGPKEMSNYRKIMKALERDDLPSFPMNEGLLRAAKERVTLGRTVELQEYNLKKQQNNRTDQLAEEAELDSDAEQTMTKKQRCRLEQLAKEAGIEDIDDLEETENKGKKSQKKKLQQIAKTVGINRKKRQKDLSSDEDEEFQTANKRRNLEWSKKQLKVLLSQPLVSKFSQTKYPTKSGQMIWPHLIESSNAGAIAKLKTQKSKNLSHKRTKRSQKRNKNDS